MHATFIADIASALLEVIKACKDGTLNADERKDAIHGYKEVSRAVLPGFVLTTKFTEGDCF